MIAGAGFRGVEIWHPHVEHLDDEGLREMGRTCRVLGLDTPVIAPYFSFTRGRERWEESIRCAKRVLHAASIIGVRKVRTFVDCGNDGLTSQAAGSADWAAACDGLRTLCSMDTGVEFVLETHEKTLANDLPSVHRLLNEVSAANLRLNFQATPSFLSSGYLACLDDLFPHVSHMHWEQILPDGRPTFIEDAGMIDFPGLMQFLLDRRYSGTASLEYCWTSVPPERICSGHDYLVRFLQQTGKA